MKTTKENRFIGEEPLWDHSRAERIEFGQSKGKSSEILWWTTNKKT